MLFSIMITSRNRRNDLRQTLARLGRMRPQAHEILVCADGCTDGTLEMVQADFPEVGLLHHTEAQGSVASRHEMLQAVKGDWVLSLDDDSHPLDDDFFLQAARVCEAHPEAALISFPELRDVDGLGDRRAEKGGGCYVSAYSNCAALMRRQFYLAQPGFPAHFFHAYEEPDYALQCYGGGSSVWLEPSLIIHHRLSEKNRCSLRFHQLNSRNELWSVWMRCPMPMLPVVSLFRIWRQFRYAALHGGSMVLWEPQWWWEALRGLPVCLAHRRPIPWPIYYSWMRLARRPIFSKSELDTIFRRPGHGGKCRVRV